MQMSTAMEGENGEMIVKRVSVPIGLEELMEGLTREVILKKPRDIYQFASEYFAHLLEMRDKGYLRQGIPRRVQSVTKQMRVTKKAPIPQLPRQTSVRSDSPMKSTSSGIPRRSVTPLKIDKKQTNSKTKRSSSREPLLSDRSEKKVTSSIRDRSDSSRRSVKSGPELKKKKNEISAELFSNGNVKKGKQKKLLVATEQEDLLKGVEDVVCVKSEVDDGRHDCVVCKMKADGAVDFVDSGLVGENGGSLEEMEKQVVTDNEGLAKTIKKDLKSSTKEEIKTKIEKYIDGKKAAEGIKLEKEDKHSSVSSKVSEEISVNESNGLKRENRVENEESDNKEVIKNISQDETDSKAIKPDHDANVKTNVVVLSEENNEEIKKGEEKRKSPEVSQIQDTNETKHGIKSADIEIKEEKEESLSLASDQVMEEDSKKNSELTAKESNDHKKEEKNVRSVKSEETKIKEHEDLRDNKSEDSMKVSSDLKKIDILKEDSAKMDEKQTDKDFENLKNDKKAINKDEEAFLKDQVSSAKVDKPKKEEKDVQETETGIKEDEDLRENSMKVSSDSKKIDILKEDSAKMDEKQTDKDFENLKNDKKAINKDEEAFIKDQVSSAKVDKPKKEEKDVQETGKEVDQKDLENAISEDNKLKLHKDLDNVKKPMKNDENGEPKKDKQEKKNAKRKEDTVDTKEDGKDKSEKKDTTKLGDKFKNKGSRKSGKLSEDMDGPEETKDKEREMKNNNNKRDSSKAARGIIKDGTDDNKRENHKNKPQKKSVKEDLKIVKSEDKYTKTDNKNAVKESEKKDKLKEADKAKTKMSADNKAEIEVKEKDKSKEDNLKNKSKKGESKEGNMKKIAEPKEIEVKDNVKQMQVKESTKEDESKLSVDVQPEDTKDKPEENIKTEKEALNQIKDGKESIKVKEEKLDTEAKPVEKCKNEDELKQEDDITIPNKTGVSDEANQKISITRPEDIQKADKTKVEAVKTMEETIEELSTVKEKPKWTKPNPNIEVESKENESRKDKLPEEIKSDTDEVKLSDQNKNELKEDLKFPQEEEIAAVDKVVENQEAFNIETVTDEPDVNKVSHQSQEMEDKTEEIKIKTDQIDNVRSVSNKPDPIIEDNTEKEEKNSTEGTKDKGGSQVEVNKELNQDTPKEKVKKHSDNKEHSQESKVNKDVVDKIERREAKEHTKEQIVNKNESDLKETNTKKQPENINKTNNFGKEDKDTAEKPVKLALPLTPRTKDTKENLKLKNRRSRSLSQDQIKAKLETENPKRSRKIKSVDLTANKNGTKITLKDVQQQAKSESTKKTGSKPSASVDAAKISQTVVGKQTSFDSSQLRKEIKEAHAISKNGNFKSNFNPSVLKQEIKAASKGKQSEDDQGYRKLGKFADEAAAVLKIQAMWRGFRARKQHTVILKKDDTAKERSQKGGKKEDNKLNKFADEAAAVLKIQRMWRGFRTRKQQTIIMKKQKLEKTVEHKNEHDNKQSEKTEEGKSHDPKQLTAKPPEEKLLKELIDRNGDDKQISKATINDTRKIKVEQAGEELKEDERTKESQIPKKSDARLNEKEKNKVDEHKEIEPKEIQAKDKENEETKTEVKQNVKEERSNTLQKQEILGIKETLRELETKEDRKELRMAEAVLKIQTIWRGFKVRQLKKRGELFGTPVEENPQNKEILTVVRKHDKKKAAAKIQAVWRGYKVRKNIKEVDQRLAQLQDPGECDEMPHQRDLSDDQVYKAATKIQAGVRGYMVRKQKKREKNEDHNLNIIQEENGADEDLLKALNNLEDVPQHSVVVKKSRLKRSTTVDEPSTMVHKLTKTLSIDSFKGHTQKLKNNSLDDGLEVDQNIIINNLADVNDKKNGVIVNKKNNLHGKNLGETSKNNTSANKPFAISDAEKLNSNPPVGQIINPAKNTEDSYEGAARRPVNADIIAETNNLHVDKTECVKENKQGGSDSLKSVSGNSDVHRINEETNDEAEIKEKRSPSIESSTSAESCETVIYKGDVEKGGNTEESESKFDLSKLRRELEDAQKADVEENLDKVAEDVEEAEDNLRNVRKVNVFVKVENEDVGIISDEGEKKNIEEMKEQIPEEMKIKSTEVKKAETVNQITESKIKQLSVEDRTGEKEKKSKGDIKNRDDSSNGEDFKEETNLSEGRDSQFDMSRLRRELDESQKVNNDKNEKENLKDVEEKQEINKIEETSSKDLKSEKRNAEKAQNVKDATKEFNKVGDLSVNEEIKKIQDVPSYEANIQENKEHNNKFDTTKLRQELEGAEQNGQDRSEDHKKTTEETVKKSEDTASIAMDLKHKTDKDAEVIKKEENNGEEESDKIAAEEESRKIIEPNHQKPVKYEKNETKPEEINEDRDTSKVRKELEESNKTHETNGDETSEKVLAAAKYNKKEESNRIEKTLEGKTPKIMQPKFYDAENVKETAKYEEREENSGNKFNISRLRKELEESNKTHETEVSRELETTKEETEDHSKKEESKSVKESAKSEEKKENSDTKFQISKLRKELKESNRDETTKEQNNKKEEPNEVVKAADVKLTEPSEQESKDETIKKITEEEEMKRIKLGTLSFIESEKLITHDAEKKQVKATEEKDVKLIEPNEEENAKENSKAEERKENSKIDTSKLRKELEESNKTQSTNGDETSKNVFAAEKYNKKEESNRFEETVEGNARKIMESMSYEEIKKIKDVPSYEAKKEEPEEHNDKFDITNLRKELEGAENNGKDRSIDEVDNKKKSEETVKKSENTASIAIDLKHKEGEVAETKPEEIKEDGETKIKELEESSKTHETKATKGNEVTKNVLAAEKNNKKGESNKIAKVAEGKTQKIMEPKFYDAENVKETAKSEERDENSGNKFDISRLRKELEESNKTHETQVSKEGKAEDHSKKEVSKSVKEIAKFEEKKGNGDTKFEISKLRKELEESNKISNEDETTKEQNNKKEESNEIVKSTEEKDVKLIEPNEQENVKETSKAEERKENSKFDTSKLRKELEESNKTHETQVLNDVETTKEETEEKKENGDSKFEISKLRKELEESNKISNEDETTKEQINKKESNEVVKAAEEKDVKLIEPNEQENAKETSKAEERKENSKFDTSKLRKELEESNKTHETQVLKDVNGTKEETEDHSKKEVSKSVKQVAKSEEKKENGDTKFEISKLRKESNKDETTIEQNNKREESNQVVKAAAVKLTEPSEQESEDETIKKKIEEEEMKRIKLGTLSFIESEKLINHDAGKKEVNITQIAHSKLKSTKEDPKPQILVNTEEEKNQTKVENKAQKTNNDKENNKFNLSALRTEIENSTKLVDNVSQSHRKREDNKNRKEYFTPQVSFNEDLDPMSSKSENNKLNASNLSEEIAGKCAQFLNSEIIDDQNVVKEIEEILDETSNKIHIPLRELEEIKEEEGEGTYMDSLENSQGDEEEEHKVQHREKEETNTHLLHTSSEFHDSVGKFVDVTEDKKEHNNIKNKSAEDEERSHREQNEVEKKIKEATVNEAVTSNKKEMESNQKTKSNQVEETKEIGGVETNKKSNKEETFIKTEELMKESNKVEDMSVQKEKTMLESETKNANKLIKLTDEEKKPSVEEVSTKESKEVTSVNPGTKEKDKKSTNDKTSKPAESKTDETQKEAENVTERVNQKISANHNKSKSNEESKEIRGRVSEPKSEDEIEKKKLVKPDEINNKSTNEVILKHTDPVVVEESTKLIKPEPVVKSEEAEKEQKLEEVQTPTNEEAEGKKPGLSVNLVHTGELHDTITVPIPISPSPSQTPSPGLVSTGSGPVSVQLNEAPPAGAEILTSLPPKSISAAGNGAQASDKDASTCESAADSEPPPAVSMETEKRNNASVQKAKTMEAAAATKIQAGFRGYQVRKQLKNKISSPGDISSQRRSARRKSSGRLLDSPRLSQKAPKSPSDIEEKSAVKIQAGVRGFLVRRRQKNQTKNTKNSS